MSEAVAESVAEAPRADIKVVTPDNFNDYVAEQLPAPVEETPETKAEAELKEIEAKKPKADEEIDHPDKAKKNKLNERFSEPTAARKAAEEKAAKAAEEAKAERETRRQREEELSALKAKYEPPKSDELGPEPQAAQFTDVNEYAKALKDWTAEATRREDAHKAATAKQEAERQALVKAWNERQEAAKAEIEDYSEKISKSDVKVTDEIRDAIIESEIGPRILYHLADNPDIADKLGAMPVARMLREFGRLEASLMGDKPASKELKEPVTVAEISKAPAPISPLKGANAPVAKLSGYDEVPKNLSYEDWKKLRQSGKIK